MGYEIEIVHLATECWLITHGYNYRHHDSWFTKGVPDFVAWKMVGGSRFGDCLIIECKADNSRQNMISACDQLSRYTRNASEPSIGAIAVPIYCVTPRLRRCIKNGQVIGVDVVITNRIYRKHDYQLIREWLPFAPKGYDWSLNKPVDFRGLNEKIIADAPLPESTGLRSK